MHFQGGLSFNTSVYLGTDLSGATIGLGQTDVDGNYSLGLAMNCSLGTGCVDECNGKGLCQSGVCLCDRDRWGESCGVTEFGKHCGPGFKFIEVTVHPRGSSRFERLSFVIPLILIVQYYRSTLSGGTNRPLGRGRCGGFLRSTRPK